MGVFNQLQHQYPNALRIITSEYFLNPPPKSQVDWVFLFHDYIVNYLKKMYRYLQSQTNNQLFLSYDSFEGLFRTCTNEKYKCMAIHLPSHQIFYYQTHYDPTIITYEYHTMAEKINEEEIDRVMKSLDPTSTKYQTQLFMDEPQLEWRAVVHDDNLMIHVTISSSTPSPYSPFSSPSSPSSPSPYTPSSLWFTILRDKDSPDTITHFVQNEFAFLNPTLFEKKQTMTDEVRRELQEEACRVAREKKREKEQEKERLRTLHTNIINGTEKMDWISWVRSNQSSLFF